MVTNKMGNDDREAKRDCVDMGDFHVVGSTSRGTEKKRDNTTTSQPFAVWECGQSTFRARMAWPPHEGG